MFSKTTWKLKVCNFGVVLHVDRDCTCHLCILFGYPYIHRFPAIDGGENEMKMGGKGGKGKRRQKGSSVSSSAGSVNKEGEFDNMNRPLS